MFDRPLLKSVANELAAEPYTHKSNDLYEFFQSNDLSQSCTPAISRLRSIIYSSNFTKTISRLTGITDLHPSKIDLSSHRYPPGGHLLCHDDDIADYEGVGRRIAFIVYLTPDDWSVNDGGMLQFFEEDKVKVSIVGSFGAFCMFVVEGGRSLHQVQEVLGNRDRLSISGWFHAPVQRTQPQISIQSQQTLHLTSSIPTPFSYWINPVYTSKASLTTIQDDFINSSTVSLHSILQPAVYSALIKELATTSTTMSGPLLRQWFGSLSPSPTSLLRSFINFLNGNEFKTWLMGVIALPELIQTRIYARHFNPGCYTLMSDLDITDHGVIDVIFDFTDPNSELLNGGDNVYVCESETLLRQKRVGNVLNIVYRDQGVSRFVKYVGKGAGFWEVGVVFDVADE